MPRRRLGFHGQRTRDPAPGRRTAVVVPGRAGHGGVSEEAEADEQRLEHGGGGADQTEGELEVGPDEVGAGVVEDVELGEGVEVDEARDRRAGREHAEREQQGRRDLELEAHVEVPQDQEGQHDAEHQVGHEHDDRVGVVDLRAAGDARALALEAERVGILPGRLGQVPRIEALLPEIPRGRAGGDEQDGDDHADGADGDERAGGDYAVVVHVHQAEQRDGEGDLDEAGADDVEDAEQPAVPEGAHERLGAEVGHVLAKASVEQSVQVDSGRRQLENLVGTTGPVSGRMLQEQHTWRSGVARTSAITEK